MAFLSPCNWTTGLLFSLGSMLGKNHGERFSLHKVIPAVEVLKKRSCKQKEMKAK
jgi:hypothetical protein